MQILKDTEDISLTNSRLEQLYVVLDSTAGHMRNALARYVPLGTYYMSTPTAPPPQWIHHRQARSG